MIPKILLLCYYLFLSPIFGAEFFYSFGGGSPFGQSATRGPPAPADDEYYRRLGVDRGASIDQIKRAYRKQAMLSHPDKGGDAEQFKKLGEAYEVLSDPDKRAMYDKYGKDGLAGSRLGGNSFGSSPFPGFGDLFRGFGGFPMPVMLQIDLTLEDFYCGKEISITIRSDSVVKVKIEPGMMAGQQLIAKGQLIDSKGAPRDLIFKLAEITHPIYKRKNADLLMDLRISLKEALLGLERPIKLLDSKEIWIKSRPGDVTSPGSVLLLQDMGMPITGNPTRKGRLFVRFTVDFPKRLKLDDSQVKTLERLLLHSGHGVAGATTDEGSAPSMGHASKPRRSRRPEEPVVHGYVTDLGQFGSVGGVLDDEDGAPDTDFPFSQFFFR